MSPVAGKSMSAPPLNVAALVKGTRLAGPGLRDLIWVQGCTLGCVGCANVAYQPHTPRRRLPVSRLVAHFSARVGRIDGCTVSGGEPSEQPEAVTALLAAVQGLGLSTVLYSGKTLEQLMRSAAGRELLRYTDLLIDGPFVLAKRDLDHPWRGSTNQRLHRLSPRWQAEDIEPPQIQEELFVGPDWMTCLGGMANPGGER